MKAIFTFLFATSIATSAFAYNEGKLTITLASKSNMQVVVDGRAYQQNDNSIVLNDVQPGNHRIQIYKAYRNGNGNGRGRNDRNELLYATTVQVKPNYHVDVMVNRFGKALVDEQALRSNGRWNDDDDWYGDNNSGGYNNNGDYNNKYNQAMSESAFNQFLQQVKTQWFNNGKMNTAKDGLSRNYFATSQVRQVLQLFSSENDKLELAKLAYRNTVDQRSYYQLYDVFSFQSTKDELDRYIKDYRY
ncbi:DUF4476 domain-containing protein [Flavisolibacter tropicus]|uniref:DUF4476 domain-containing protein n=1 Tax=Flavisolibacter tropicus TaxID=1492898 RepID=A0A172TTF4_9BACT|nr:DUF4476 domain-containing protein [Flavisolibacter tropicus]ANE50369.1 hypothetical protein SY85_07535 [Flavisolibacter tropicus]